MNFVALLDYISTTPLTWILLTLSAFKIGIILYEKANKHALLQPIIVAYVIIIPILLITNMSYERYFESVAVIHFFLGPATVALALPLYKNFAYIKSLFSPIVLTLIIGGAFSIISATSILWLFDAQLSTILSMTTKSITAPIAVITSEKIGAIPSLALGFIIITGVVGALFGNIVFKIMKIKSDVSKGFALGLTSHAIGIARAMEISDKATAFGALGMGLFGILTAIILPIIIHLIL
jgi:predicted murein hydrolase (TIGR00659 family)